MGFGAFFLFHKTGFVDNNHVYTYGDIEEFTNRLAHYCLSIGLKAGDTVAIFMDNKPGKRRQTSNLKHHS